VEAQTRPEPEMYFWNPIEARKPDLPCESRYVQLRDISGVAKQTWLNNSQVSFFIEFFINLFSSALAGDKSVRRCKKILYAGAKSARNILINLNLNPPRGLTGNSGSR